MDKEERVKNSFFGARHVEEARKKMSPEELQRLVQAGEYMYGQTLDEKLVDGTNAVFSVETAIQSGLLPCDMTTAEVETMLIHRGLDWWKRYGFTQEEADEAPKVVAITHQDAIRTEEMKLDEATRVAKRKKRRDKKRAKRRK